MESGLGVKFGFGIGFELLQDRSQLWVRIMVRVGVKVSVTIRVR